LQTPLVNKQYVPQRFAGNGGRTNARIPEILPDKQAQFGRVRVRRTIDGVEINKYYPMPMGNGNLFLPVNAVIRKKIEKQAGDIVQVVLYKDDLPVSVPAEPEACLWDEPLAYAAFVKLTESEQVAAIKRMYSAKKEQTIAERIAIALNGLLRGKVPGNKLP